MSRSKEIQKEFDVAMSDLTELLDRNNRRFPILLGEEEEAYIPLETGWRRFPALSDTGVVEPCVYGEQLLHLTWHHPDNDHVLEHAHPFWEAFKIVGEGEMFLFVGDQEPVRLTEQDPPFRVPARKKHQYKVTAGTTIITTYPREVVAEETLKPERSDTPIVPITDPREGES